MTSTTDTFAALRSLDRADLAIDPRSPRARADLERILTVDPGHRPARPPVKDRARRRVRVAAVVGATAVTAGAAFVVLPALTSGDRAFASWTATPTGLSAQEAADAAANCRGAHQDGPDEVYSQQLSHASIAIAERRGEWTLVTLAGTDGFSALCITDESTPLFRDWIGSIGTPAGYTPPGQRDVVATDLGSGSAGAGDLSVAAGFVGADVTDLVYRSANHGDVAATVSGGRFALWLPGDELEGASRLGVEVEATYRDGSTGTVRLSLE